MHHYRANAVILLSLIWVLPASAAGVDASLPAIGIIIDDMGYRLHDGYRAIALPGPLAYSFLPHTPNVAPLSKEAQRLDKEVLLHLPMEAIKGNLLLGPGALRAEMDERTLIETLHTDLASVPAAIGINNHMGSRLTREPLHMRWLMDAIKSKGLFFIDSKTIQGSVAAKIAWERAVPTLARDIFIDNEAVEDKIRSQFSKLIAVALRRGYALGIAHPKPTTIEILNELLPQLETHGVRLAGIRELLAMNNAAHAVKPTSVTHHLKHIAANE